MSLDCIAALSPKTAAEPKPFSRKKSVRTWLLFDLSDCFAVRIVTLLDPLYRDPILIIKAPKAEHPGYLPLL